MRICTAETGTQVKQTKSVPPTALRLPQSAAGKALVCHPLTRPSAQAEVKELPSRRGRMLPILDAAAGVNRRAQVVTE